MRPSRFQRLLAIGIGVLLTLAWFGGGATVDVTPTDEWLMLLALPVICGALVSLLRRAPDGDMVRPGLLLAGLVAAIPLLQLVDLPGAAWGWPANRDLIARDLAMAGVSVSHRWSLWPEATERSLFALLPALACFLGALAVGERGRRTLLPLALALVAANLAFGIFQVGLPPGSSMRLHENSGTGFGGVLVNGNHQGTALIVGMLLALGLWARESRRHRDAEASSPLRTLAYAVLAVICLAAVPLTSSSGAMVIATLAFAAGLMATGVVSVRRMRRSRRALAVGIGALGLLLVGLVAAWGWMNVAETDADRFALARDVLVLGSAHAPLGSGAGTFVDSFAQGGMPSALRSEYINHAHNEYAQWWFEAGWLGLLAVLAALALYLAAGWRLLRAPRRDALAIACWLAVGAVLAHSWVDFPLRTLSLMSMVALLAGFVLAAAGRTHEPAGVPDAVPQPA